MLDDYGAPSAPTLAPAGNVNVDACGLRGIDDQRAVGNVDRLFNWLEMDLLRSYGWTPK
ncbi:MAG: hypothetical protein M1482_09090 [Chloroflexi bacterium]|nr:hypothetical protein [Chloroflexota bacterium]